MSAIYSLLVRIASSRSLARRVPAGRSARRSSAVVLTALVVTIASTGVGAAAVESGEAAPAAVSTPPTDAEDSRVSSCRTITQSGVYELSADLESDGTCIRIRASNVVFDGNNHTVTQASGLGPGAGIVAGDGGDPLTNVTVRNVTATYFDVGVWFRNVDRSEIRGVNASCNREDGFNVSGDGNRVVANLAFGNHRYGFVLPSKTDDGMQFDSPANNVVAHNLAVHNGGVGVLLGSHTNNNTVVSNVARSNAGVGFDVRNGRNNVFRHDRSADNFGAGFSVSGDDTRLVNVTAVGNDGAGLGLWADSLVRNSTVVDNDGFGAALSEENRILNTTISDNAEAGVQVRREGNVVANSTITDNGGPAFEDGWGDNELGNNTVAGNRDQSEEWEHCRVPDAGTTVTRWCNVERTQLEEGIAPVSADFRGVTGISLAVGANNTVDSSAVLVRSRAFPETQKEVANVGRLRSFDDPLSGHLRFRLIVKNGHYGRLDIRVVFDTPDGPVVRHVTADVRRFPYLPTTGANVTVP